MTKTLSAKLKDAANELREEAVRDWKDDPEMQECVRADAESYNWMATLAGQQDWDRFQGELQRLDTNVREDIWEITEDHFSGAGPLNATFTIEVAVGEFSDDPERQPAKGWLSADCDEVVDSVRQAGRFNSTQVGKILYSGLAAGVRLVAVQPASA